MREVSQLLEKYDLGDKTEVELVGAGLAGQQFPPAGKPWSKKLRVVFKSQE